MAELQINAADLGLLTSVYFLVFAAVQLPFGALLDRHGPKTIQSVLLLLASSGALIFALADGLIGLIVGRAVLSLGVALALMAGFKAIVLWFPPERIVLANGWYVTLGALGAVTATAPAEFVVQSLGWRGLFALLAALSALAALLLLFAVPECHGRDAMPGRSPTTDVTPAASLWAIYRDRRFWRMAPLSAIGIGASWSLQGLWAAPWLRDVAGLDRAGVVEHLSLMAFTVCSSALLLGMLAKWLRRRGIKTEWVLAGILGLSTTAQLALLVGWPLPSYLLWSLIAAAGAATVLSFAILTEYFPREMSGRANAALNLLHVGGAFVLQSATGFVVAQWPQANGSYPAEAHQTALAVPLVLQFVAFVWFVSFRRGARAPSAMPAACRSLYATRSRVISAPVASTNAILASSRQFVREQVSGWRLASAASASLCLGLTVSVSKEMSEPAVAVHVVEVDYPGSGRGLRHRLHYLVIGQLSVGAPIASSCREPAATAVALRQFGNFAQPNQSLAASSHCGRNVQILAKPKTPTSTSPLAPTLLGGVKIGARVQAVWPWCVALAKFSNLRALNR
jgi:MFS family permease